MNTISYRELRKYQDYRFFRRTQKLRASGGFFCLGVFWERYILQTIQNLMIHIGELFLQSYV